MALMLWLVDMKMTCRQRYRFKQRCAFEYQHALVECWRRRQMLMSGFLILQKQRQLHVVSRIKEVSKRMW
jgi:lysophospholipid acyltransferase (LPLAT)-like uncharacterized protein